MHWLFLAIISSAAIALVFKHSELNGLNRLVVTCSNYLTAMALALIAILIEGLPALEGETLTTELHAVTTTADAVFSPMASAQWAVLIGIMAGTVFYTGFIVYQISVKNHGVGLAGAFGRMGVLVPMLFSLLVWTELPTPIQWVGIVLAMVAISIVNVPRDQSWKEALRPSLLGLFLLAGFAEFSHAIFQKYAVPELKNVFLLSTFGWASLISIVAVMWKGKGASKRDWLTGIAVGLPNFFSSYFLVRALLQVPSSVAFPLFSAGAIVLIMVGGYVIFHERLKPVEKVSIGLTILAVVLINL